MKEIICYREYRKEDKKALENVIRQTWNYDKFASPRTAEKLARLYLASCLANQTYTQTAVADGRAVGIILGKKEQGFHCPFRFRMGQLLALAKLLVGKEGRRILKFYGGIGGLDQELLKRCGKEYQGEVALFAIDPAYRGQGIGKQLFSRLKAYMEKEGILDFYLFTDTSCNFGFYEHQGMIRRQREKKKMTIGGQTNEMEFYLYDGALKQQGLSL